MNLRFDIPNLGSVELLETMGSDADIASSARVCYGSDTNKPYEGLLRHLIRKGHTSPIEFGVFRFKIEAPIVVARQWIRHRMSSTNEWSGRYSILTTEFYTPDIDRILGQDESNKQGSAGEIPLENKLKFIENTNKANRFLEEIYQENLELGVAKELARISLPLNLYTKWVWKIDLHNLFKFLMLRADSHAQREIQLYAEAIEKIVEQKFPICYQAWLDYEKNAIKFSAMEKEILHRVLYTLSQTEIENIFRMANESKMSKNEIDEFSKKLNVFIKK